MANMCENLVQHKKLSHKQFRLLLKKKRRKLRRQRIAQERDELINKELGNLERSPSYHYFKDHEEVEQQILEEHDERERRRQHYLWLQREEEAIVLFKKRKEQEDRIRAQKEEESKKAREDLEKLQNKELNEKKIKEDALKEVIDNLPEGNEPWHNPIAPQQTEVPDNREICNFFSKTGACRFGERCSRKHHRPDSSKTILLKGMFTHFCMEEMFHDEYDTDIGLEFEDSDMHQFFVDFYEDVLPEFKKIGQVVQFKVCCNQEQHLRGNVYVQFERETEAEQACQNFNGRYYGGKQLSCEYTCVTKWKSAICGLFMFNRCPKGRTCNFLHVFNNPNAEFRQADRDFQDHDSSIRNRTPGSYRNGQSSSRSHRSYHDKERGNYKSSSRSSSRCSRTRTPSNRSSRRSRSRTPLTKRSKRLKSRTPSPRSSRCSPSLSSSQRSSRRKRSRTPKNISRRERYSRSKSRSPPKSKLSSYERRQSRSKKRKSSSSSSSSDVEWVEKSNE